MNDDWHTRAPDPGHIAAHRDRGWCMEVVEYGWRPDGMAEWWVKDTSENYTLAWGLAQTVDGAMSAADDAAGRLEGEETQAVVLPEVRRAARPL